MEFTGEIKGIVRDWQTNQYNITFSVNESYVIENEYDKLKDSKLSIKAVKFRKKRSLDANAYLWVILSKLAEVHKTSKDEMYEEMLQKYPIYYQDEDGNYILVTLKADIDTSKLEGHWQYYKSSEDGKFKSYLMIKGTSLFNTSEMSHFIEMVVQEAKGEGIETLPPEELERMKSQWNNGKT